MDCPEIHHLCPKQMKESATNSEIICSKNYIYWTYQHLSKTIWGFFFPKSLQISTWMGTYALETFSFFVVIRWFSQKKFQHTSLVSHSARRSANLRISPVNSGSSYSGQKWWESFLKSSIYLTRFNLWLIQIGFWFDSHYLHVFLYQL